MSDESKVIGFRIDPSIRVGDVLVVVGMLGAAYAAYATLDKRVALLEDARVSAASTVAEVRRDVKDIQSTVNAIRGDQWSRSRGNAER